MTLPHPNEGRFDGVPEIKPRCDVRTSRFTPDTLVEYRDLVFGARHMGRWVSFLYLLRGVYEDMPDRYKDELNGFPGVQPLELDEAIKHYESVCDEMDAGLHEWERFS